MNKEDLLSLLETLKLSKEEFVILSSSSIVLRGILETANDLDIAVTEKGLTELKQNYELKQKENGWYIVTDKIECVQDDMVNQKEKLDEYYLQDINSYLSYLETSKREKDIQRIPLVKKYINNKPSN